MHCSVLLDVLNMTHNTNTTL